MGGVQLVSCRSCGAGTAFPDNGLCPGCAGHRDRCAVAAMATILGHNAQPVECYDDNAFVAPIIEPEDLALVSYQYAEAMLAERNRSHVKTVDGVPGDAALRAAGGEQDG